jgi:hypothetical protein
MKQTFLRLILGVMMLFAGGVVMAQGNTTSGTVQALPPRKTLTPEEKADRQTRKLTERLTLTNEQQTKVRAILLASIQQEDADRKNANGDMEKLKTLNMQRDEKKREEIKKILTENQVKIYDTPAVRQTPPPPAK